MKDYKRLTQYMQVGNNIVAIQPQRKERIQLYIDRLFELEDKIESGEIVDRNAYLDYLMSTKNVSEVTDKEIEFFAKHNARVREYVDAEIARLTAELAALQKRLKNAVELPCKVGDAIFYVQYFCDYKGCDSETQQFCCGCKEMLEREKRKEKYVICEKSFALKDFEKIGKKYFTTRKAAEARLAELQGGKE